MFIKDFSEFNEFAKTKLTKWSTRLWDYRAGPAWWVTSVMP